MLLRCVSDLYCGQISRMVNKVASSAKLGVNIPKLNRRFQNNICHIAGSCFSCGLIFNVDEMSIALNTDYLITGSPLCSHLLGCLFLK